MLEKSISGLGAKENAVIKLPSIIPVEPSEIENRVPEALLMFKPFDERVGDQEAKLRLFVKETAITELAKYGWRIVGRHTYTGEQLQAARIPERHYADMYDKATMSKDKFSSSMKQAFATATKIDFETAAIVSAYEALAQSGMSPKELDNLWNANKAKRMRLSSGFYTIPLIINEKEKYVINGFVAQGFQYFFDTPETEAIVIRGSETSAPLEVLRDQYLGDTSPEKALPGSVRELLRRSFGEMIDAGNNGSHLSAGPVEAMVEHNIWFGVTPQHTVIGAALGELGYSQEELTALGNNPTIAGVDGPISLFDATEKKTVQAAIDIILAALPPKAARP